MAVYKRGYQRYRGPLTSHWTRVLAMPRFAWQRLSQQRLVTIMLILALVWPLLCGLFIYVSNHSELWKGLGSDLARLLEINGKFFLIFMNLQAVFAVLLAALAGPGLIAPDLANNALPLYFSRPLNRVDYAGAKMAVLAGLLSLVTWVPGIALFIMQSSMAGWTWFSRNWKLGVAVFAGFALWILLVSLVALASSAYVKWRVIAGALVLGFFFITAGLATMVNAILRVKWGSLVNPAEAMYRLWSGMLGVEPPQGIDTSECVMALAGLVFLLIAVLNRKLKPVEVVS
jgi:ABC-2 type transport system permease protein